MRVIAGKYRSLNLKMVGSSETRETSDKVRGAVFNSLAAIVPGSTVLDLFAGSGSYGIEALSRGAWSCSFVDKQRLAIQTIKDNIQTIKIIEPTHLIQNDYQQAVNDFLLKQKKFDIIILDPPYEFKYYERLLLDLSNLMHEDSIIVCETHKHTNLKDEIDGRLELYKSSVYGIKKINYLRLV